MIFFGFWLTWRLPDFIGLGSALLLVKVYLNVFFDCFSEIISVFPFFFDLVILFSFSIR